MNPRPQPAAALPLDPREESTMETSHAKRDLLMAIAMLLLAASACVYGFIKIVPLALAHGDKVEPSTSEH